MSDVKIKVSVDAGQANQALSTTQKELAATAVAAVKADSSLSKLGNGASQAGNSLINLGRIVQDAPFGFIGIQNNINPLLESFQQLKTQTGSTGAAFKALGSSLMGGAGLGLAVSLATSALTVLAQSGFFNAGDKAKKAAEEAKKFKDEVKGIAEDAAKEQANVLILVKALESETVSRKEKLAAVKELQSINPKYFGDLKLEGELVQGLSSAYQKYKDAIIATIQNKIDSKLLESSLEKINKLEEKAQQNKFNLLQIEQKRAILQKAGADPSLIAQQDALFVSLSGNRDLNKEYKTRDEILKRIADRNFEGQTTVELDKSKKAAETINDVLEKLRRGFNKLSAEEDFFGVNKAKEKISEIESAISTLTGKFKVNPKGTLIQSLFGDGRQISKDFIDGIDVLRRQLLERFSGTIKIKTAIEIKDELDKAAKEANDKLGKDGRIKPIKIPFQFELPYKEERERLVAFITFATDEFTKFSENVFAGIGEALGNALTGEDNPIGGFFTAIGKLLASSIKELGKQLIVTSTLVATIKKALNAAFSGNPALGIAVGIGLIAVGTALENSLPGFANGVNNFRGGYAMVGERGPEIVRLPSGSDVIPNHRMNAMQPGGMSVFIPDARISGNDIVISYTRSLQRNNRNGG